ncbi:50S ribosomal protein L25/general stress protein Ctc [Micrococcus terreus]|uniref:50S ribosomal protein L25/general stress protein Ctc n=1 Tax=Micrococcus terreus TaxID=574650 RepID=UPI0023F98BCA|nr:50S ribosomal protein L25/general stress protein Ctc [Micrococcus terreus]
MSDKIKIQVTKRTDFGKGASRQARRDGFIPAVVYGHGAEPVHLLMPAQETSLAVRNPNALLTVVSEGEEHMVLPKDIQRNPLKQTVDHLDLIEVRRGEKVIVDVTVHVEGEAAHGTAFNLEEATVPVEAEATHLPEFVTIDIEGREVGDHVYGKDVRLPAGTTLQLDDDYVIATVSDPVVQDLGEEPEAEGESTVSTAGGSAEGDDEKSED